MLEVERDDEMKLTKADIATLQEALQFGIHHVREGTADYEQREARIREMQTLSRKLTEIAKEADG